MSEVPITVLDLAIIGGYFAIVAAIGVVVARKTSSGDDLFLAGRSLGWAAVGASLFASNISSTTLIGLAGDAYRTGISVANYEWMAALVLVFMAVFFVPFYLRSRVTTIPEFLEKRYDARSRKYFSVLTIFLSIMVDTAGGIYAGALVLKTFFPELDTTATCIGLALFAGIYTAAGGLAAVVYTDVMQTIILICGSALLTVTVFGEFGYSWTEAVSGLPEAHLSLIRPIDDPTLPWLGTLVGLPILGFYYWATNQYIVQRVLGSRDLKNGRWGTLFGGSLKLLPLFIMVLPGALAWKLFPGLENPDKVFPTMVAELLPPGVTGLVLAGLIAAIMSSIDSTLNSASTLVTIDFVQPRRKDLSPKQTARVGRLATVGFMLVAALWAPFIGIFGGLFSYLQTAFSYVVPPVVVIFIMGVFWRRGSGAAAFVTLVGGHLLSAGLFVAGPVTGMVEVHFAIMAGVLTGACVLLYVAAALIAKPAAEEKTLGLTWASRVRDGRLRASGSAWKDYRIQAALLVAATVVVVVFFW